MIGVIASNIGEGRYDVAISPPTKLVDMQKSEAQQRYEAAQKAAIEAGAAWADLQTQYDALVSAQKDAIQAYNDCILVYDEDACRSAAEVQCFLTYGDCRAECGGEPDCVDLCTAQYESCLALAAATCAEAHQASSTACYEEHIPKINAAQEAALQAKGPLDAARAEWESQKAAVLAATARMNELNAISSADVHITCWHAQYEDSLSPGTAVVVAHGPGMGYAITGIYSTNLADTDARAFPSQNLFVNAALETGRETWLPSWRSGTVLDVGDETLAVRVDPGWMYGTLGTQWSKSRIDCTPSQACFMHEFGMDTTIAQRRQELEAAQAALAAEEKALSDCIAAFDQEAYLAPLFAQCDAEWLAWLELCYQSELDDCATQYDAYVAACKNEAIGQMNDARAVHESVCRQNHPLTALQDAVALAQAALIAAEAHIYQPASPAILDVPVAHCQLSSYEVGDRVLLDFPDRGFSASTPMAVWDSARVVGWYENPRDCFTGAIVMNNKMWDCGGDEVDKDVPAFGSRSWSSTLNGKRYTVSWNATAVYYKGDVVYYCSFNRFIYSAAVRYDANGALLIVIMMENDIATGGKAPLITIVAKRLQGDESEKILVSRMAPLFPVPQYVIDAGIDENWSGGVTVDGILYYRLQEPEEWGFIGYESQWKWYVDIDISPDSESFFFWNLQTIPAPPSTENFEFIPNTRDPRVLMKGTIPAFDFDDLETELQIAMQPVSPQEDSAGFLSNLGDFNATFNGAGGDLLWITIGWSVYLGAHYSDNSELVESVAYITKTHNFDPSSIENYETISVDMEYKGGTFSIYSEENGVRVPMFINNGDYSYARRIMVMSPWTKFSITTADYSDTNASVYFDGQQVGDITLMSPALRAQRCDQQFNINRILSSNACLVINGPTGDDYFDVIADSIDRPCRAMCLKIKDYVGSTPTIRHISSINGNTISEVSTAVTAI